MIKKPTPKMSGDIPKKMPKRMFDSMEQMKKMPKRQQMKNMNPSKATPAQMAAVKRLAEMKKRKSRGM